MTQLTLDLPPDLYERLRAEAERVGQPPAAVAQAWLAERLPETPRSGRERGRALLLAAGLLAEPGPEMQRRAARSTATIEEVRAALDRAGGKPLSQEVLEMRGPRE